MNTMIESIKLFTEGNDMDVCASQRLVYYLQAIVTIADAYIDDYTGPGGDEVAPMETVRMLAVRCLREEVSVKG